MLIADIGLGREWVDAGHPTRFRTGLCGSSWMPMRRFKDVPTTAMAEVLSDTDIDVRRVCSLSFSDANLHVLQNVMKSYQIIFN